MAWAAMVAIRLLIALALTNLALGNLCSTITDCSACVGHKLLEDHTCFWCETDAGCHAVGSSESPCTPGASNDFCISNSSLSACSKHSDNDCSAVVAIPRQIHLSHCGDDCMRVSWKTDGPLPQSLRVAFAYDGAREIEVPADRSVQYLRGHGYHHAATLTALKLGTTYRYRIIADGATSTARSFKTPSAGQKDATFLVFADLGYREHGEAMESRDRMELLKQTSDMVIHAGDIGYADDSFLHGLCFAEFCYESVYDGYMEWMENITDNLPYMVSVGNHESECHSPKCLLSHELRHSLNNFSAYNARWNMPSRESGGVSNMWYSFDYASVHWIALNTETDFSGAPEEDYGGGGPVGQRCGHFGADGAYLSWLEADLKKANSNRAERPWIIAFGHRPWMIKDGVAVDNATRVAHQTLFEKYGVDLYINGHKHSYHRLLPVNQAGKIPTITVGGAGCDEFSWDRRHYGPWDEKGRNHAWDYRYYNLNTTVSQMKVTTSQLIFNTYASASGDMIDTVTLTKGLDDNVFV